MLSEDGVLLLLLEHLKTLFLWLVKGKLSIVRIKQKRAKNADRYAREPGSEEAHLAAAPSRIHSDLERE